MQGALALGAAGTVSAEGNPADSPYMWGQDDGKVGKGKSRAGEMRDFVTVKFPAAKATSATPRANDYEVQLENRRDAVVRVLSTRRVYSPGYSYGYEKDDKPVVCNFPLEDVPVNDWVRFVARPVNSFQRKGETIVSEWFRFDGKTIPKNLA
jgi:hypothetical protein